MGATMYGCNASIFIYKSQVVEFMKICNLVWCLGAFSLISSKNFEKITANKNFESFDRSDSFFLYSIWTFFKSLKSRTFYS